MTQVHTPQDLEALLKANIRDVPNFPETGILFRDITTLLANAELFHLTIEEMARPFRDERIDKVIVIESRGFIFGTPIAYVLGAGVVPVRKPGKLPAATYAEQYSLEYGVDSLEIHQDAIHDHERILIVDDLLATGGTVEATIRLARRFGGEIAGVSVLAELVDLNGRLLVGDQNIHSLVRY